LRNELEASSIEEVLKNDVKSITLVLQKYVSESVKSIHRATEIEKLREIPIPTELRNELKRYLETWWLSWLERTDYSVSD